MRITASMLRAKGACAIQCRKFRAAWPHGADVNLDNVRRAKALGLDVRWVAENFLSGRGRRIYENAVATGHGTYMETAARAWKEYEKVKARAVQAYVGVVAATPEEDRCTMPTKKVAAARRVYAETTTRAWEEYRAAVAEANRICDEAMTVALVEALQAMDEEQKAGAESGQAPQ